MSVIKPINFINDRNSRTLKASVYGFLVGAFFMGCLQYYMFLKTEVSPRVPALLKSWSNYKEVESLHISKEFVVEK